MWAAPNAPERADTGWTYGPGTASYREAGGRETDFLPIAPSSCFTLSGLLASDGPPGGIAFWFDDNAHKAEPVNLAFDGDHVSSASSAVEYHRLPSELTLAGTVPTRFTLVVGRRAAALVVKGKIRAAVQLPKSVSVKMVSQRGVLDVTDMRTGPAPDVSGC